MFVKMLMSFLGLVVVFLAKVTIKFVFDAAVKKCSKGRQKNINDKICNFWPNCKYGDNCRFKHPKSLQNNPPNRNQDSKSDTDHTKSHKKSSEIYRRPRRGHNTDTPRDTVPVTPSTNRPRNRLATRHMKSGSPQRRISRSASPPNSLSRERVTSLQIRLSDTTFSRTQIRSAKDTSPPQNRLARTHSPPQKRFARTPSPPQKRFARTPSPPQKRFARTPSPKVHRRPSMERFRPAQKRLASAPSPQKSKPTKTVSTIRFSTGQKPRVPGHFSKKEVAVSYKIPQNLAGVVIGRAGQTIKGIMRESCTKINLDRPEPNSKERTVSITGVGRDVTAAIKLIQAKLSSHQASLGWESGEDS